MQLKLPMSTVKRPRMLFVRFLLVGALNTAFGYGVFAFLLWLGLHYAVASAIATVLGVLFNFQSTGRLVFDNLNPGGFLAFIQVYVLGYFVNLGFLWVMTRYVGLSAYVAGALMILPMAMLTFFLQRKFVFKNP